MHKATSTKLRLYFIFSLCFGARINTIRRMHKTAKTAAYKNICCFIDMYLPTTVNAELIKVKSTTVKGVIRYPNIMPLVIPIASHTVDMNATVNTLLFTRKERLKVRRMKAVLYKNTLVCSVMYNIPAPTLFLPSISIIRLITKAITRLIVNWLNNIFLNLLSVSLCVI